MPRKNREERNAYMREWKRKDRRRRGIPTKAEMKYPPRLTSEQQEISKERRRVTTRAWNKKYNEEHPQIRLYRAAKKRAKERGLEFDLEKSDIVIPEFCPYLGIKLVATRPRGDKRRDIVSLDRIDNTKGYIRGNVEVISHLANTMKNSATKQDLINFATYILKRYQECE